MPQQRGFTSANAPKVSLTPPSDHGLKTVKESEGALADVHPRW